MTKLLAEAGKSFLRAFGVTFLFLVTGILSAPNQHEALALAGAASVAALVAGIKVIQEFIPALYVGQYISKTYGAIIDSAVRAFIGAYAAFAVGVLSAPDLGNEWKTLGLAGLIAAATAAVRAVQGFFTAGDFPAPERGFAGTPADAKPAV